MLRRTKEMPPEEVFSRTLFGMIMIGSTFFAPGKWVILIMGFLFILSALTGVCLTCKLYRLIFPKQ